MSVVDWICKKISLESASEQLSAITISRQQVLPSKLDACANVTTCCSDKSTRELKTGLDANKFATSWMFQERFTTHS